MSGAGLLIFGRTGQVARELARRAPGAVFLDRGAADLADPAACAAAVEGAQARAVINAAAYTAVDRAEEEEALATVVNGAAPAAMAGACAAAGIPFLHVSTDYVFDGSGTRPWAPGDPTGPLGAYGRSKLAGEQGIAAAGGSWAILRTSWVVSAHGSNFVRTMLRLGAERDALSIVADQVGGPTPAADIAAALLDHGRDAGGGPGAGGSLPFLRRPGCELGGVRPRHLRGGGDAGGGHRHRHGRLSHPGGAPGQFAAGLFGDRAGIRPRAARLAGGAQGHFSGTRSDFS